MSLFLFQLTFILLFNILPQTCHFDVEAAVLPSSLSNVVYPRYDGITISVSAIDHPLMANLVRWQYIYQNLTGLVIDSITTSQATDFSITYDDLRAGSPLIDCSITLPEYLADKTQYNDLLDLTEYVKDDTLIDWFGYSPFFREYVATFAGKIYAVPLDGDMHFLYYREDVLQSLNLSLPNTWDELLLQVPHLQGVDMNNDGIGDDALCLPLSPGGAQVSREVFWNIVSPYLQSKGSQQGAYFDILTGAPLFDNDAFLHAAELYTSLSHYGTNLSQETLADSRTKFLSGGCAYIIDWGDVVLLVNHTSYSNVVSLAPPLGTYQVYDRNQNVMRNCDYALCPYADSMGINRAPFAAASGGWSGTISSHISKVKQDACYSLFSFLASPGIAAIDHLAGNGLEVDRTAEATVEFWIAAGFSPPHSANIVQGLTSLLSPNIALELRVLHGAEYYVTATEPLLYQMITGQITPTEFQSQMFNAWSVISERYGNRAQLNSYRNTIGLLALGASRPLKDGDPLQGSYSFLYCIVAASVATLGAWIANIVLQVAFQHMNKRNRSVHNYPYIQTLSASVCMGYCNLWACHILNFACMSFDANFIDNEGLNVVGSVSPIFRVDIIFSIIPLVIILTGAGYVIVLWSLGKKKKDLIMEQEPGDIDSAASFNYELPIVSTVATDNESVEYDNITSGPTMIQKIQNLSSLPLSTIGWLLLTSVLWSETIKTIHYFSALSLSVSGSINYNDPANGYLTSTFVCIIIVLLSQIAFFELDNHFISAAFMTAASESVFFIMTGPTFATYTYAGENIGVFATASNLNIDTEKNYKFINASTLILIIVFPSLILFFLLVGIQFNSLRITWDTLARQLYRMRSQMRKKDTLIRQLTIAEKKAKLQSSFYQEISLIIPLIRIILPRLKKNNIDPQAISNPLNKWLSTEIILHLETIEELGEFSEEFKKEQSDLRGENQNRVTNIGTTETIMKEAEQQPLFIKSDLQTEKTSHMVVLPNSLQTERDPSAFRDPLQPPNVESVILRTASSTSSSPDFLKANSSSKDRKSCISDYVQIPSSLDPLSLIFASYSAEHNLCLENVYFLVCDYYYRRIALLKSGEEVKEVALWIYENCIAESSLYQVNISDDDRQNIIEKINNLPRKADSVFSAVQQIVLSLIATNMPQLTDFEQQLVLRTKHINHKNNNVKD